MVFNFCCMKPYNIKGAAKPIYVILAQVKIVAQVKVCEARRRSLMTKSSYCPSYTLPTVCLWIGS